MNILYPVEYKYLLFNDTPSSCDTITAGIDILESRKTKMQFDEKNNENIENNIRSIDE